MPSSPASLPLADRALALVYNSGSGRKDAGAKEQVIRARLAPRVKSFTSYEVSRDRDPQAAARQALRDGADLVVALGGDGTQSAVAGVLAGSDAVMGVLPGGTFNYFAREAGVGDTVEAALDTLETGTVRRIDVGEVNGRIFLNNANFGVYPRILERREAIYQRWGRSRLMAYWSVLVTLWDSRDPMHLILTADGETREFHTALAFAARSAYQLENLGLDGAEAVRRGKIALFLAKGHRPAELLSAAFRLAVGSSVRGQDFDLMVADEITIETRQHRRTIAFDGEKERLTSPFHLKVHREALAIIVPAPTTERPGLAGATAA